MWQTTTIKGLDEALAELQRAIESLPDTAVKKQLQDRYRRLQGVRENLENKPSASCWNPYSLLGVLVTAVVLALIVLHLATRER
ncbi:MAG: hypothetical protein GX442_05685 [Candidatus Riflebacteria bacterium]|nr:hypothetical protein [Candidatus Riflebacteria bacterium]